MRNDSNKRIVVVSDLQVPFHDKRAVQNVVEFVREFAPDELVNIGDDIDAPEPARWNKGSAMEYSGTLQAGIDATRDIHAQFRDALGDKPYHVSRSNHGDRTARYIKKFAPALDGLRALELPTLLGYDELGISFHTRPFKIAPGWVACHGDEGGMSRIAGRTAGLLSEKWGTSVVCGHTHRAGLSAKSYGFGGRISKTVYGLEVGNLMDLRKADYLGGGSADWQQGFAVIYACRNIVSPVLVPIQRGGKFVFEGRAYGS